MSAKKKQHLNNQSINPSIGSEVDQKYLKSFYPKPEKGMKWLYTMFINVQGIDVQAELLMEITEMKGENITVKTAMGNQSFENNTTIDAFSPLPTTPGNSESSGFIYEGSENLVLPVGEIKDTIKLNTISKAGKSYLWLSYGIGPVKFGISVNGIPGSLELKQFIS